MGKRTGAAAALLVLAGCATNIHPKDETIAPSKVPFGTFAAAVARPLAVDQKAGEAADPESVNAIRIALINCLNSVFPKMQQVGAEQKQFAAGTVIIEPAIEDMKRVTSAQRFFAAQMAGSSAVLLRTRYIDASSGEVIASPVFYAKADAKAAPWIGGARYMAGTDYAVLGRVAQNACSYAKANY